MVQEPVLVVLAAGGGSRFAGATHKLEQPFGASTVLGCTLSNAMQSGLPLVVVTTPALNACVASVVAARDIVLVPEVGQDDAGLPLGMGYSIACGVSARANAHGWLVLPGDMPLVEPATLRAVAAAMPQHPVVYAQHRGRRGHPVAFAAEIYSELVTLGGDEGARRLIGRYPAYGVDVDDAGVLMDLDTEDDLERLRAFEVSRSGAQLA